MSKQKVTLFQKFIAFWLSIGLFALFGGVTWIASFLLQSDQDKLESAERSRRLSIKKEVEQLQLEEIGAKASGDGRVFVRPEEVFPELAKRLATELPETTFDPLHVVPGSAAAMRLEEAETTIESEEPESNSQTVEEEPQNSNE